MCGTLSVINLGAPERYCLGKIEIGARGIETSSFQSRPAVDVRPASANYPRPPGPHNPRFRSIREVGDRRVATDGAEPAAVPAPVAREGVRAIVSCVGRRRRDAVRPVCTSKLGGVPGRARLTWPGAAPGAANAESVAEVPHTPHGTPCRSVKLPIHAEDRGTTVQSPRGERRGGIASGRPVSCGRFDLFREPEVQRSRTHAWVLRHRAEL